MEKSDVYQSIYSGIDSEKYDDAINSLASLIKDNPTDAKANHLLGYIYQHYKYANHSKEKSKKYLHNAINSDSPIENSFTLLSKVEENKNHKIRILRRGLELFPNSPHIYDELISIAPKNDVLKIYNETKAKQINTHIISRTMLMHYIETGNFEDALESLSAINVRDNEKDIAKLLEGVCHINLGSYSKAEKIFKSLIDKDLNHTLEHAQYFGIIIAYVKNKKTPDALTILGEIPIDISVDTPLGYSTWPLSCEHGVLMMESFNLLENETRNRAILAKIRGIRGRYLLHNLNDDSPKNKAVKDLIFANRHIKTNTVFCEELHWVMLEDYKYYDAYLMDKQYLSNLYGDELKYELSIRNSDYISDAPEDVFEKICNDFTQFAKSSSCSYSAEKYIIILRAIVCRLFKGKKYRELLGLVRCFDTKNLADVLFEIGYAYSEIGNLLQSKKHYELLISNEGYSVASANNLALVYEKMGNYSEAEKLLLKALKRDKNDKLVASNYKRIIKLINAKDRFSGESKTTKKKIYALWQQREFDGNIIFNNELAKQAFNVSSSRAISEINKLVEKGYLISGDNNQYRINTCIEECLKLTESELKYSDEIDAIANNISLYKLRDIGLTEHLLKNLDKLHSNDLKYLLNRDLKETAINLLCSSYKSVIVMCGSILESVLLDKIFSLKIKRYKNNNGKNTPIKKMALDDLLYVALSENIVDRQLYHLGHALRGYRNLIHPGVEQRKTTIVPNKSNARIAWDVTKKFLTDI